MDGSGAGGRSAYSTGQTPGLFTMLRRSGKAGDIRGFRRSSVALVQAAASSLQSEAPAPHVYKSVLAKLAPVEPSDMTLVAEMAAGHAEALRKLGNRYSRTLMAAAQRILRDGSDAEEVATDVLWQAWRQASGFDAARGSVSGWLMTLARSRAIDRLRARNSRRFVLEGIVLDEYASDPMFEVYSGERRKILKAAVASLQDNERTLLELAYFSDLPQSEIAARLELPLGTVKTRMRGALIKLRNALAGSSVLNG